MKKYIILSIVLILLGVIFFPYLKVEYLTMKYGDEFVGLEQQTKMLNDAKYLKVFSYNDTEAVVYYLSDTRSLITFNKDSDNNWQYKEWRVIWSKSGNADEFIWPYYK